MSDEYPSLRLHQWHKKTILLPLNPPTGSGDDLVVKGDLYVGDDAQVVGILTVTERFPTTGTIYGGKALAISADSYLIFNGMNFSATVGVPVARDCVVTSIAATTTVGSFIGGGGNITCDAVVLDDNASYDYARTTISGNGVVTWSKTVARDGTCTRIAANSIVQLYIDLTIPGGSSLSMTATHVNVELAYD